MKKKKIQLVHNPDIAAPADIYMYIHCNKCMQERPKGQSPAKFARLNVGFTPLGFQVWCVRHNCNVNSFEIRLAQPLADNETPIGLSETSR
jgi:hypothetical protein